MSKQVSPTPLKIDDLPLWKKIDAIVEHVYDALPEFPEEEKWQTSFKLRSSANDLLFTTAQALGNASPTGAEHDWGQVQKHALALKTMYRFAGRQHFIKLDPQVMVDLDAILQSIDKSVAAAYEQTKEFNKQDLAMWHEKYKLWKETM